MPTMRCNICKIDGVSVAPMGQRDASVVDCPRCSHYGISGTAEIEMDDRHRREPDMALCAWIRDHAERGTRPPLIDSNHIHRRGFETPAHTVAEKIDLLLHAMRRRTKNPGAIARLHKINDWPLAWAEDRDEFEYYVDTLVRRGLATREGEDPGYSLFKITPDGFDYLGRPRSERATGTQAFVAMWLTAQMQPLYDQGLKPAIQQAGYDPYREGDTPHDHRIDARIMNEIQRSRFLIADATGARPSVFWEAGYALALGKPVIWTVRQDMLDRNEVPFDTRQFQHLPWTTPPDLIQKLADVIVHKVGRGSGAE